MELPDESHNRELFEKRQDLIDSARQLLGLPSSYVADPEYQYRPQTGKQKIRSALGRMIRNGNVSSESHPENVSKEVLVRSHLIYESGYVHPSFEQMQQDRFWVFVSDKKTTDFLPDGETFQRDELSLAVNA